MKRAQLSVEFIILMAIILFIGSAMIISQVNQMNTFDAIGDSFEAQVISEKNAVALQSVSAIGVYSSSDFHYVFYNYDYSNSSYLSSLSYQNSFAQSAIPGITLNSQSLANYSKVSKSLGGFFFE